MSCIFKHWKLPKKIQNTNHTQHTHCTYTWCRAFYKYIVCFFQRKQLSVHIFRTRSLVMTWTVTYWTEALAFCGRHVLMLWDLLISLRNSRFWACCISSFCCGAKLPYLYKKLPSLDRPFSVTSCGNCRNDILNSGRRRISTSSVGLVEVFWRNVCPRKPDMTECVE